MTSVQKNNTYQSDLIVMTLTYVYFKNSKNKYLIQFTLSPE